MAGKIEDILDNCLERIFKGESIEDCLKDYPEHASELEPLLKTSSSFMQKSFTICPDSEFKARTYSQLRARLYTRREKAQPRGKFFAWSPRWAVAFTAVLVVLIASTGTVAASTSALPGEKLYPIKLATENVRLTLAFSDMDEAKLHIQFAERRAEEIAEMARRGEGSQIPVLTEQLATHLDEVNEIGKAWKVREKGPPALGPYDGVEPYAEAEKVEKLKVMLSDSRLRSLAILENSLEESTGSTKPSVQQAISDIKEDYDKVLFKEEAKASQ